MNSYDFDRHYFDFLLDLGGEFSNWCLNFRKSCVLKIRFVQFFFHFWLFFHLVLLESVSLAHSVLQLIYVSNCNFGAWDYLTLIQYAYAICHVWICNISTDMCMSDFFPPRCACMPDLSIVGTVDFFEGLSSDFLCRGWCIRWKIWKHKYGSWFICTIYVYLSNWAQH